MAEKSRPPQDEDIARALASLAIGPEATWEEVRRHYKKLAFEHHETKVGSRGTDRAAEVNWSYAVLKEAYLVHRLLPRRSPDAPAAGFRPYFREPKREVPKPPEHPSEDGEGATQSEPHTGKQSALDLHKTIHIDLLKAAMGGEVTIKGSYRPVCSECNGLGKAASATACQSCNGSGRRKITETTTGLCTACNGTGSIRAICRSCMGAGKSVQRENYAYQVCIPPWTRPGMTLRLRGKGMQEPGRNARGDLLIEVEVESTEGLQVLTSGDVVGTLAVSPLDWLAGGVIQVRTLRGIQDVEMQAGQARVTLNGEGFERAGGQSRGDLVYRVQLDLQGSLDQTGRLLVEKAKAHWQVDREDKNKAHKGWLERVKRRQRQAPKD